MKNLKIVNHPLVEHYLSIMRDKNTGQAEFKNSLDKVSYFLAVEAYSSIGMENKAVSTPFKKINGKKVKDKIIILPILRAGLGLTQGFVDLYPEAITSLFGFFWFDVSL